ncbi:MAG: DMT family transporter [Rhodospirillales bacterium]|nr:DMT family transporter [Rhodospirillales bacterium]
MISKSGFIAAAPVLFVLLWSTGFIGTKYGMPYAEPFTFLAVRFAITAAALTILAVAMRAPWPATWREGGHIVIAGLLLHGIYLGGVFSAVSEGVSTGVVALIAGLQPLLTAGLVGRLLGEKISVSGWVGLMVGFVGVGMVVWERLSIGSATITGMMFAVMCLIGITFGALYQKKFCATLDLRSGNAIQLAASAILVTIAAVVFETREIQWTGEFIFALIWLSLMLSITAISLLYYMLRIGQASRVTSIFYLTPAVTSLMGFMIFGEALGALAIGGIVLAGAGVALINR